MKTYGIIPHVHDPIADPLEVQNQYGIDLVSSLSTKEYINVLLPKNMIFI